MVQKPWRYHLIFALSEAFTSTGKFLCNCFMHPSFLEEMSYLGSLPNFQYETAKNT